MSKNPFINPSTLQPNERDALMRLALSDGWQVLQRLIEKRVQESTLLLLQTNPNDRDAVFAAHTIAYAQNEMAETLIADINFQRRILEQPEPEPEEDQY